MEQPYETRILFLGLDGVGKSTIIAKLRDFKVILYNNNRTKKLQKFILLLSSLVIISSMKLSQ